MLTVVQPHSERQQKLVILVAVIWTVMDTLMVMMPSQWIQPSGATQTEMDTETKALEQIQMLALQWQVHRHLTDLAVQIAMLMAHRMKT
tara:strand:- start:58 stop:324 length:267 start_codon:yes stop_codon:yes gene_type:complete